MSNHLDLLCLRADAATAAREQAEQNLLSVVLAINPRLARWPAAMVLDSRALDALVEHTAAPRELVIAHAAYCRARRTETEARSAAHCARFQAEPPTGPSITSALTADAVYQGLAERRLAA